MSFQVTIIGSSDRKLEELVRASGLRPAVASVSDLMALTHPGTPQPDVLVVDVRAHGQVPAALGTLRRQHPETSVVLVAAELAPALMLEAMRAGVNECLAPPLNAETVGAALARVAAHRTAPVGGKVFAFVGAKGGVGTTTLAVNVATALAKQESRTLFVDMHPAYGDASVLLGAEPRFSLMDALENTHRLDLSFFSGLTAAGTGGVTLLASPDNAPGGPIDVHRIRLLLDFAARNYRFTVLDVPRSNPAMLDALESATSIVVVTNQELASIRGASRVSEALSRRYGRDTVSVVVSRYDKQGDINLEDIEEVVQPRVRFTFPSDYRLALQALNDGRPFVLDGGSRLAAAVTAFASELIGEPTVRQAQASKPGRLLARLGTLGWMTST